MQALRGRGRGRRDDSRDRPLVMDIMQLVTDGARLIDDVMRLLRRLRREREDRGEEPKP